MPKLTLEDKFFREVVALAAKLGCEDKAYGMTVRFFREAQQRHREGKGMTEDEFKSLGFSECLFPTFARRVERGIIAAGAEKYFAWLDRRAEAGRKGGRLSAARPRDEKGRLLPQAQPSTVQANPSTVQAKSKQKSKQTAEPTLFPSLSVAPKPKRQKAPKPVSDVSNVWESYREAYLGRYQAEPQRNATVNSLLVRFVARLIKEEAPLVAAFYVWHNDAFYVRALHPISLMLRDAESLRTQWARGKALTGTDAREVERAQSNLNAFSAFADLDKRVNNG